MLGLLCLGLCTCVSAEKRCSQGEESLDLVPTSAVTLDGFSLQRSSTTGRYQTDGGVDFDVNVNSMAAVDPLGGQCLRTAGTVLLTVSDPFTGITSTLTVAAP